MIVGYPLVTPSSSHLRRAFLLISKFQEFLSPNISTKGFFDLYQKTTGIDLWNSHYERMEENYRRLKEINKKMRREIRERGFYLFICRQRMGGDLNELNIKELQALKAKMDSSLLAIRERKPPLKRLLTMFLGYHIIKTRTDKHKNKVRNLEERHANLVMDLLLNSPDERHRRLHEILGIHRDPNRNLFSDDASGELDEKKKGMELSVKSVKADKIWHYQDPLGKIQGPFAMAILRGWSSSGHFPPELRVWRVSEKQENSILLTDTLVGQYSQLQQLVQHSHMPTEDASMAIEDGCWNKDEDARESKDQKVNQMESKQPEGSLNLMQNDISGHCQILEVVYISCEFGQ
ncbi:hypothetical protein E1A91_D04G122300v1 [Gossypium mustelinum]|uniref:GYF domain-containing protein n=1 Tax=Gossypium mustelinum TaxID=34275 RepID=A0A5D2VD42_GOSMU|nr:hypothetical protein E1A91_D04G122300v1 [Gossypium mustelinum]TYI87243.1 hypothetical protein E1A91_D04G122300v1 [Gossypium mustelinum]TYI87247.1 hypothetical protein E1A91_D04G122300v1 [Gossypium mustelinum]